MVWVINNNIFEKFCTSLSKRHLTQLPCVYIRTSQQRKIDINTIYNYLNALEGAYILYRVPHYDAKGKEILKTQEKFYLSDISLLYSTMGFRDRMISGVLENIIFLELKRGGYQPFVGKLGDKEIDFVAERKGQKIYIQVAYKIESNESAKREFGPDFLLQNY